MIFFLQLRLISILISITLKNDVLRITNNKDLDIVFVINYSKHSSNRTLQLEFNQCWYFLPYITYVFEIYIVNFGICLNGLLLLKHFQVIKLTF